MTMPNLSDHPLIKQSYDVSQAIEACGASTQLTAAVTQSSALTEAIGALVNEQCLTGPTCVPLGGLKPHEQRVVVEKSQLDMRIERLRAFLQSGTASVTLDADDRILLENQLQIMRELTAVLAKRIDRFYKEDPNEQMVLYRRAKKPSREDPLGIQVEDVVIPLSRFNAADADGLPEGARRFECMPRSLVDSECPYVKWI